MTTAKLTDDGRLLCPDCPDEQELTYCQQFLRRDAFRARFDKRDDQLFMIGEPLHTLSETLEVYDEYLLCPRCKSRHNVPWSEDSDMEQDMLEHEGDFLRVMTIEGDDNEFPLPNQCPKCGKNDRVKYIEKYPTSRDVMSVLTKAGVTALVVEDETTIEFDGGGEDRHLYCAHCSTKWSLPGSIDTVF